MFDFKQVRVKGEAPKVIGKDELGDYASFSKVSAGGTIIDEEEHKIYIPVVVFSPESFVTVGLATKLAEEIVKSPNNLDLWDYSIIYFDELFESIYYSLGKYDVSIKRKFFYELGKEVAQNLVKFAHKIKREGYIRLVVFSGREVGGEIELAVKPLQKEYYTRLIELLKKITELLPEYEEELVGLEEEIEKESRLGLYASRPNKHELYNKGNDELLSSVTPFIDGFLGTLSYLERERKQKMLAETKHIAQELTGITNEMLEKLRARFVESILLDDRLLNALDVFLKTGKVKKTFKREGGGELLKGYLLLETLLNAKKLGPMFGSWLAELNSVSPDSVYTNGETVGAVGGIEQVEIDDYSETVRAVMGFALFTKREESKAIEVMKDSVSVSKHFSNANEVAEISEELERVAKATLKTAKFAEKELYVYIPQEYYDDDYHGDYEFNESFFLVTLEEDKKRFTRYNELAGSHFTRFLEKRIAFDELSSTLNLLQHFSSVDELERFLTNRKLFKREIMRSLGKLFTA